MNRVIPQTTTNPAPQTNRQKIPAPGNNQGPLRLPTVPPQQAVPAANTVEKMTIPRRRSSHSLPTSGPRPSAIPAGVASRSQSHEAVVPQQATLTSNGSEVPAGRRKSSWEFDQKILQFASSTTEFSQDPTLKATDPFKHQYQLPDQIGGVAILHFLRFFSRPQYASGGKPAQFVAATKEFKNDVLKGRKEPKELEKTDVFVNVAVSAEGRALAYGGLEVCRLLDGARRKVKLSLGLLGSLGRSGLLHGHLEHRSLLDGGREVQLLPRRPCLGNVATHFYDFFLTEFSFECDEREKEDNFVTYYSWWLRYIVVMIVVEALKGWYGRECVIWELRIVLMKE
ncbi:hypothetical protein RUND412_007585 [Rhizina undulata]